ncbi:toll/interleukin-1 receptor domain-containing protein [Micromonospora sp. NPDC005367]|uniref:toll/interleukin-1 receptor domain-containing protein n=1 Tax=Micromonospora sp. NPDC005367 TaxID=3155590 RepID=UPI0033B66F65
METGQVFVSYSRDDEDLARALRDRLHDASIDCFIDSSRIRAGDHWRSAIVSALHESAAVVVVCTNRSVQSHEVTFEWSYASGLRLPVIPVIYEPSLALPAGLDGLARLDFVDPRGRQWDRLVSRILEARAENNATVAHLVRLGISNVFSDRQELFRRFTVSQVLDRIATSSDLLVVGRSLEAWAREFRGVWTACETRSIRARFALVDPALPKDSWMTPSAYATLDVQPSVEKFRLMPHLSAQAEGSFELYFLPNAPLFSFTYYQDLIGPCGILEIGAGLPFEKRHSFILRATDSSQASLLESILATCESMLTERVPAFTLESRGP